MTGARNNSASANGLAVAAFFWILVVVFVTQVSAWLLPVTDGDASPTTTVALLGALESGLVAIPLLGIVFALKPSPGRAAMLIWLSAAALPLVLAPSRLIAPADSQLVIASQVVSCAVVVLLLRVIRRRESRSAAANPAAIGVAVGAGALAAMPWLVFGALGSPLDLVLALLLGVLVGRIAGQLTSMWLAAMANASRVATIGLGGFVIGGALLLLASALSTNGGQIPLMLALPALGWLCVALGYGPQGINTRPAAILVALAITAVVGLVDTDSVGIIALDPALSRAFGAAMLAVAIGWLLALAALASRAEFGHRATPWAISGGVLWLAALTLFVLVGQPGFNGDRLFVVLKDQGDVAQAATITNYDQRRQFVYRTLTDHATASQAGLRSQLDRFGIGYEPFYLVNALEVRGGLFARLLLMTRGDVDRVLPSPHLRPLPDLPDAGAGTEGGPTAPQWNLTNIGADRVWAEFGARGAGIVVGQSDSGAQWDHPELRDGYRGRNGNHDYNWLDPWTSTTAPVDAGGHGTHTLGSVLGNSVGVAPDATWFGCANLQRNVGNPALYLACMQFMLAPYAHGADPFTAGDPLRSANVLNNSWGCPRDFEGCDATVLQPAVDALSAAGIFVVASAGNEGPSCSTVADPIAIYANSFSVGAIDEQNDLAGFSSVGPVTADGSGRIKPDILAPGVGVLSSLPNSTYGTNSGTSMAGPHIAGVVALMWSANPALVGDIAQTRQILQDTATPFSGSLEGSGDESGSCLAQLGTGGRPNPISGYGVVNAYAAVQRAVAVR